MDEDQSPESRGVQSRGDETRNRLIEAGLQLFGAGGLEGVSTREIASAAGTNLASINYHFGGKKGLYMAVTHAVAERMGGLMQPVIEPLAAEIADAGDDRRALARIAARFLSGFLRVFLVAHGMRPYVIFILREYADPGEAFEHLYPAVIERVHRAITRLAAVAGKLPDEHPDAILAAHAIVSYGLGFGIGAAPLNRRMGWTERTPAAGAAITRVVIPFALKGMDLDPADALDIIEGDGIRGDETRQRPRDAPTTGTGRPGRRAPT